MDSQAKALFQILFKRSSASEKRRGTFPRVHCRKGQKSRGRAKIRKRKGASVNGDFILAQCKTMSCQIIICSGDVGDVGDVALVHEFIHFGNYSSVQL